MISICVNFIMQVQKFGGSPLRNFGAKTCKMWPDFTQLPTLMRISPERDKISKIHKVVHASLDPPKSPFSGDYISAPTWSWPLKFLHALEIDKGLLAHIANRVGGPLKNCNGQQLKLGLKFHICPSITLG